MNWLSIVGDAFWILALAFIGATLRQLAAKIGPQVRLPLPLAPPKWRLPRNRAFGLIFGIPLLIGLALSFAGRWAVDDPSTPLLFFCLKTASAGAFAVLHLGWLRKALRLLLVEGAVKP